jgi:hypothetical protein
MMTASGNDRYFETIYTKGQRLKKLIEIEVEGDMRLWIE